MPWCAIPPTPSYVPPSLTPHVWMQNGTFVDTPGDAPDLEDEELRLPLAPCGADIGSDTRALLPQVHPLLA